MASPWRAISGSATPRPSTRWRMMSMAWTTSLSSTGRARLEHDRDAALQVEAEQRLVAGHQRPDEGRRGEQDDEDQGEQAVAAHLGYSEESSDGASASAPADRRGQGSGCVGLDGRVGAVADGEAGHGDLDAGGDLEADRDRRKSVMVPWMPAVVTTSSPTDDRATKRWCSLTLRCCGRITNSPHAARA